MLNAVFHKQCRQDVYIFFVAIHRGKDLRIYDLRIYDFFLHFITKGYG